MGAKCSFLFSVPNSAGALHKALQSFAECNVNMTRLESRPNNRTSDFDFVVSVDGEPRRRGSRG